MARLFDDASSEYLINNNAVVSDVPLSMAAWFNSDTVSTEQGIIYLGTAASTRWWCLELRNSVVTLDVSQTQRQYTDTTSGPNNDTWHHGLVVAAASDDFRSYLDGGNKGTNAVSNARAEAPDATAIGARRDYTPGQYFSGRIAEAAIWNAALTDANAAELAAGYSPLCVRPDALVAYWRLIRGLTDIVGGYDLTASGTTVSAHPRIIYPKSYWTGVTIGAAGGVDVSLDTLALTGAAQGMTVSPGAVNVALDALGLTAAAQSLTVQAVTTIALDALALVGVAQGLTVAPGEATTALDLLTLTGAAQGLTVSSGAVSVALDALGLTATAQGLTVSPGAVSVVLDALGLSASAETITISSGVIVALNALALSIQAESLGVSPGAVAVELASLGLTGAAQGLDILPGAVTIALDALTLASAAGPLTLSTGIRVALDALALTGTVLGTIVEPGAVGVSLDALNLTAAILALSIAAGADMIDVDVSDALVWGAMVADALLYHVEVSDTSRE